MIPFLRIETLKNHTLWGDTYLSNPNMGVPPPPPGEQTTTCTTVLQSACSWADCVIVLSSRVLIVTAYCFICCNVNNGNRTR